MNDNQEKIRKILKLSIPATIENLLQTLVGFADTLMISQIGLAAVTAIGLANAVLSVYLAVFIALGVGSSSLIARSLGAKDSDGARAYSSESLLLAIIFGMFFGIASLLIGRPLLTAMGAKGTVLRYGLQFFSIVGGASLFVSVMNILGSILRASGDTKTPMMISTAVNLLNIGIDYVLIFGIGPFPALGVTGTAIGTVVSRIIGCWLLFRKVQVSEVPVSRGKVLELKNYPALLKISIPAALERLVMRLGQVLYFSLIAAIGPVTFAAHSIAGNIESFTYMPGYGLAAAASTLAGMAAGAKKLKEARVYAFLSVKIGILIMSLCGAVLFFGSPLFAGWFTKDPEAVHQVVTALRIDAFIQPMLAASLILTGALQGLGDTKSPLYATAIGMWGIRIIGVLLLGQALKLGITGIWLSIGIDLTLRAFFLSYRFRKDTDKAEDLEARTSYKI